MLEDIHVLFVSLVYPDGYKYWAKNIKVKGETQKLLDASTEFCLWENAEKTKRYMFMSRHQIARQHSNIKICI